MSRSVRRRLDYTEGERTEESGGSPSGAGSCAGGKAEQAEETLSKEVSADRWANFFDRQDSLSWKELHKARKDFLFSASMIADLTGVGYKSAGKRYDHMKGYETDDDNNAPPLVWGKTMEPVATRFFYKLFPEIYGVNPGFVRHPTYHHIGASLDQICINTDGELFNWECKCPFSFQGKEHIKVPSSVMEVKARYLIQTCVQMECLGVNATWLFFYSPNQYSLFALPRAPELFAALVKIIDAFRLKLERNERPGPLRKDPNFLTILEAFRSRCILRSKGEVSNNKE